MARESLDVVTEAVAEPVLRCRRRRWDLSGVASAAPCTGLAPAPRAALLAPTDDRRPLSRTVGAWLSLVIAALPELLDSPCCVISVTTIKPFKHLPLNYLKVSFIITPRIDRLSTFQQRSIYRRW